MSAPDTADTANSPTPTSTPPAPTNAAAPNANTQTQPLPTQPLPTESDKVVANKRQRKRLLSGIALVCVVLALLAALWWYFELRNHVDTDDAYVGGDSVQITPKTSGTVIKINANENDYVKVGQPLVLLDRSDAEAKAATARAKLAQTVREVRALYANTDALNASISSRQADSIRQNAELSRLRQDFRRRSALVNEGAVSREDYEHAKSALVSAEAALAATQSALQSAREQHKASLAQTEGVPVASHPNVLAAAANLREALLSLQRTTVVSPLNAYVARRMAQVGASVSSNTPMMTLVPLDQLWVEANFKEVQLRDMRIGQPVKITADMYGKGVVYHGKVEGLGIGTGAAFSLIPAQNASGNWIKVVQRVPVRIALEAEELRAYPLRLGLSVLADVNITDQSGLRLTNGSSAPRSTEVYDNEAKAVEAEINAIIQNNLGHASSH